MNKTTIVIIAVLFAALLVVSGLIFPKLRDQYGTTEVPTASKSEDAAPDFTVYDPEGTAVSLTDFAGKPTVVNFWATWCGYCVQELPDFNEAYEEYGDRVNFIMVDLADGYRETKSGALEFAAAEGYSFPIYFDTDYDASRVYSISGIPMTVLVDAQGNLYKTHNGLMSGSVLREYIEAMLAEEK